ncbi:MAG TPA: TatD family deoxyribonuclease [Eggerthellaceae bacterium]|nr:TatD family deoxyribonuclease [Eggerthellaceae bacterium]
MSPVADFGFYQRRKHDKWREVQPPVPPLEFSVADSHAHVHMLPDPAWELARCGANGVGFLCMIVDPAEDGPRPFDLFQGWIDKAESLLQADAREAAGAHGLAADRSEALACPEVRIAVGVHPHNAKLYDAAIEAEVVRRLNDSRVGCLGEIGLDYHYDLSPREVQRQVFSRQIQLAKDARLPIALHLRGGEDSQRDDAHAEALAILRDVGFPPCGTLLHCCALPPDRLQPWLEEGCFVAYGGAITFKAADAAREGARIVPEDRLMLETDAPYMTPEPMRGSACTPAHVVFTAQRLAEVRGKHPGSERLDFLRRLYETTTGFYTRLDKRDKRDKRGVETS